jgi:hypothetical protein
MTEEELNRLEALATHSRDNRYAFAAIEHFNLFSLIRLARIGLAVTPRPMAEAPRDTYVYAWHRVHNAWIAVRPISPDWWAEKTAFTHFIPLSALPKPGGE